MFDRTFTQWWLSRVVPFRDVPADKLAADQEICKQQQVYNQNYAQFLNEAVLPGVDALVQMLRRNKITHSVTTWGNQLALRVHLSWRWGELIIVQSAQDCVSFDHHITTEGERRGEDHTQDHAHIYDLRDPLPPAVVAQELQFFLGRLAQDLSEPDEPEIPPGETGGPG